MPGTSLLPLRLLRGSISQQAHGKAGRPLELWVVREGEVSGGTARVSSSRSVYPHALRDLSPLCWGPRREEGRGDQETHGS